MIVMVSDFGQLGNQLFMFSKFYALAREYDFPLINLAFIKYAPYFKGTYQNHLSRVPARKAPWYVNPTTVKLIYYAYKIMAWLLEPLGALQNRVKVLRLDYGKKDDLNDNQLIADAREKTVIFAGGWPRYDGPRAAYEDEIREYFSLVDHHQANVDALIAKARSRGDMVIGVHIRQGDYRFWQAGKYFYEVGDYITVLKKIVGIFEDTKLVFLIASDTQVPSSDFLEINHVFAAGHYVEDMYALAGCDLIVGPPSTYSNWSAYFGGIPKYTIRDVQAEIVLDELLGHPG